MCIIAFDNRKTTERLDRDVLVRCQARNPHGIGIMWSQDDKLHTWRTMDDLKGIWDRYATVRGQGLPVALHFRKTTKGTTTFENVHPFEIKPGIAFMHNGTAKDVTPYLPKGISDTNYINSELFQTFPSKFLSVPLYRIAIENLIDGGRMLFMDYKGRFSILNETRWGAKWDQGVWFSKGEHLDYYLKGEVHPWQHYIGDYTWWDMTEEERKAAGYPSYPSAVNPKRPQENLSRKERKAANKVVAKEAMDKKKSSKHLALVKDDLIIGPEVSHKSNLIFDYGFLDHCGFYDERIKEVGHAEVQGHKLWALGDDNAVPAALLDLDTSIHGTIYQIDKDYKTVIEYLDQAHGYNSEYPNLSVYSRRWVKARMGGINGTDIWVYIYRYTMPLNETSTAAVVPFGDWTRWDSKHKAPKDITSEIDILIVDEIDMDKVYECPECGCVRALPYTVHEKGGDEYVIIFCNWCSSETIIETEE